MIALFEAGLGKTVNKLFSSLLLSIEVGSKQIVVVNPPEPIMSFGKVAVVPVNRVGEIGVSDVTIVAGNLPVRFP